MKNIEIKEVSNGFVFKIDKKEYVYNNLDLIKLLEHVGKVVLDRPVNVTER